MTSAIQYQGRKARRAGSEQRRRAILEAALRLIIREGVRSVRHRAVAKEADVPLSATTYYFKDITDLIADTFTLFAEQAMEEVIEPFRDQAFAFIDNAPANLASSPAQHAAMLDALADMTTAYVVGEVTDKREHLIAEQAFMHEAVLDERLRGLADLYKAKQLEVLVRACEKLGTSQPHLDAELIYGALLHLEYEMLSSPGKYDQDSVRLRLRHILGLLVEAGRE